MADRKPSNHGAESHTQSSRVSDERQKPGPKPKDPSDLRARLAVMFKPKEIERIEAEAERLGITRSKVVEQIVIKSFYQRFKSKE